MSYTQQDLRNSPDGVAEFVESLESWGGDIRQVFAPDADPPGASVDFYPPLPGDQPIASSAFFTPEGAKKSTIRYGVLDGDTFIRHPTQDPEEIARLVETVDVASIPEQAVVVANFGDPHREPRPHTLVGWRPSMSGPNEVVVDGDPSYYPDPAELFAYMKQAGRAIRREYRGEWVAGGRG